MKNFLWILFSLLYTGVSAQVAVSGKVVNDKEQPIEYAEVSLINTMDTTNIKTVLTNKAGKFSLFAAKENYTLSAVSLGQELVKKN